MALFKKKLTEKEAIVRYGDLIADLCQYLIWDPQQIQSTLRSILRRCKKSARKNRYERYERAWVLRIAWEEIQRANLQTTSKPWTNEQVELLSHKDPQRRLESFDYYFLKLPIKKRMVLLLKDKHGISFHEIASILGSPENSLKLTRVQAIQDIEQWIWEPA